MSYIREVVRSPHIRSEEILQAARVMSSALSIYFGLPEARLFRFPPGPHPPLIRPAREEISWKRPINISSTVYNFSLDARVPIITACLYLVFVCALNYLNKKRRYSPWPITRRTSFTRIAFVHNILLSIFSAWIFLGVYQTVTSSLPPPPRAPYHIADVLCRFDRSQGSGLLPESTAVGSTQSPLATLHDDFAGIYGAESLWEKGMNYYTWLFYISKYYEVIDTVLLLVKGKRVSSLQMYHHAGLRKRLWVSP
ncbi:GNS1/SUR4 family-domain-containing protein [Aspergillus pseudonomiae]|uniref:Elongation of fatty acids protein n=1 Tax=Aspergillus pseudonomiae TaxID=1506151 RepID=A0A5N6IAH0_9EURO|nr:GNS1/SUR4 family-domain-containing protein [Aspergillus pseudonomiae]KAB8262083.1 GNS1/SUR4 family-domain-containing protein [Aspergillus pseudonomiae]KAE8402661.1 GNS1/SUR4 family-domain-containing protein [Aspergillus pseudonomiae]